jgi:hypothetical protein
MYIEKLLIQMSQLLTQLKIPYLITGSIAYSVYAIPRATRDIEALLQNTNADKAYIKQWCEYLDLKTFNLIE